MELGNAIAALLPVPSQEFLEEGPLGQAAVMAGVARTAALSQAERDVEVACALAHLVCRAARHATPPQPPALLGARQPRKGGRHPGRGRRSHRLVHRGPVWRRPAGHPQLDGEPPAAQRPAASPLVHHSAVRALLLAGVLSLYRQQGTGARLLRRLSGLFDDPAALEHLGEQLAAAQARLGDAAPRLPSGQQLLLQLWLRMCVRAANTTPDAECWRGILEWGDAAGRRLTQLDSANSRAWQERGLASSNVLRTQQRHAEMAVILRTFMATARASGNRYHSAYSAYCLAVDGPRLKLPSIPPGEAAALLRERRHLRPPAWRRHSRAPRECQQPAAADVRRLPPARPGHPPVCGLPHGALLQLRVPACALAGAQGRLPRCAGRTSVMGVAACSSWPASLRLPS